MQKKAACSTLIARSCVECGPECTKGDSGQENQLRVTSLQHSISGGGGGQPCLPRTGHVPSSGYGHVKRLRAGSSSGAAPF